MKGDPELTDAALRAVIQLARDASLRPMQDREFWYRRALALLPPVALAVAFEELLKRRREARGEA